MNHGSSNLDFVDHGGVTSPAGFLASGIVAGLKKSKLPDLAMIASESDCDAAGTFTSNLFPAAPVRLCRERIAAGKKIRAVIVNSGIANACTGELGYEDAIRTAEHTAGLLHVPADSVLVSSTGRIGVRLPLDVIFSGAEKAVRSLSCNGGSDAAHAIMTTDTKPKEVAVSFSVNGKKVTVGGMTKGAGMIAPHMLLCRPHATMLCYITTDAKASSAVLSNLLADAVEGSFNRISVDNDMSTNDTCLLLANGASGVVIENGTSEYELMKTAVGAVTLRLAQAMVMDGEGSTKFVTVEVKGAASVSDAKLCAKAIADSMLCKTAWYGCDPNWGRVLAAAGYSGAQFDPMQVSLDYDEMPVVRGGMDAGTPEAELCTVMKRREFKVSIDLGAGTAAHTVWTSDISHDYVKINADYHT